jgi:hypothetical protein
VVAEEAEEAMALWSKGNGGGDKVRRRRRWAIPAENAFFKSIFKTIAKFDRQNLFRYRKEREGIE